MTVYQHMDEYRIADGIGCDAYNLSKIFKKIGLNDKIVCRLTTRNGENNILHPDETIQYFDNDIHIFHYGGAGYPFDYFFSLPGKKILRYHNVTPSCFFAEADESVYTSMQVFETRSMLELDAMKREIDDVLSVSRYNAEVLLEMGYSRVSYMPIIKDYSIIKKKSSRKKKIGFIGRIVPNKKFEDIISILFYLRQIDPGWHCIFIGTVNPVFAKYYEKLNHLVHDLNLDDYVTFQFGLSEEEKLNELMSWSCYISMSEHEGFGIPLLESFSAGVPVLAFSSSGVSETLRKGGILIQKKDFRRIAGLVCKIDTDKLLRNKVLESQYTALNYYIHFPFEEKIKEVIFS